MSSRKSVVDLPLSSVPAKGKINVVQIRGHRIGLMWVDGVLHAVADRCPHRGAPICSAGELVGRIDADPDGERIRIQSESKFLRCPWHRWDFEIETGRSREADKLQVRRYRVEIVEDAVQVDLGPMREE